MDLKKKSFATYLLKDFHIDNNGFLIPRNCRKEEVDVVHAVRNFIAIDMSSEEERKCPDIITFSDFPIIDKWISENCSFVVEFSENWNVINRFACLNSQKKEDTERRISFPLHFDRLKMIEEIVNTVDSKYPRRVFN